MVFCTCMQIAHPQGSLYSTVPPMQDACCRSADTWLTPVDSPLKKTGNKSPYIAMQVPQWNVANDVVEDFDAGLEYGEAERILKSVQRGDSREYLVQ